MAGPTFWPIEQMPEVMRFYREFLPAAPRAVNGFFAAMTVPPVDLFPEELHMRKVCAVMWCIVGSEEEAPRRSRRCTTSARRCCTASDRCRTRAAEPVRRALHQGSAVLLASRLRQRALRRADRAPPRVGPEAAVDALDDAPLPDRRRRARRRQRARPRSATATRSGPRSSSASTPTRPTPTRCATGASATGTRHTPTRPAAPTSTS